jgi:hypothetical protein
MEIRDEFRRALESQLNPATRSRGQRPISVKSAEELELFATMTGFKAHEPDEQGISARVFGAVLDNSGAWNERDVAHASFEELHVILYVEEYAVIAVNLSELLSWGAEYGPLLRRQRQEWEESRPVRANKLLHRLVECGMVGIGTSVKEWKQAQVSVCDHIDGPGSNMSRASRIVRALREEKLLKEPVISGSVAVVARAVGDVNEEG